MKLRIIYILLLLLSISCRKEKPVDEAAVLIGDWELYMHVSLAYTNYHQVFLYEENSDEYHVLRIRKNGTIHVLDKNEDVIEKGRFKKLELDTSVRYCQNDSNARSYVFNTEVQRTMWNKKYLLSYIGSKIGLTEAGCGNPEELILIPAVDAGFGDGRLFYRRK